MSQNHFAHSAVCLTEKHRVFIRSNNYENRELCRKYPVFSDSACQSPHLLEHSSITAFLLHSSPVVRPPKAFCTCHGRNRKGANQSWGVRNGKPSFATTRQLFVPFKTDTQRESFFLRRIQVGTSRSSPSTREGSVFLNRPRPSSPAWNMSLSAAVAAF